MRPYSQQALPWRDRGWHVVAANDPRARALADRHYSRLTPGSEHFVGSGAKVVMLTDDERAMWSVILNRAPGTDDLRWRCNYFRNEGSRLSSELIAEAFDRTLTFWRREYGAAPPVRMTTEIDPLKVRRKRDPGRCFRKAGWVELYTTNGAAKGRADLVVLGAPVHEEAQDADRWNDDDFEERRCDDVDDYDGMPGSR